MQELLKHFRELSLHPKNAAELKGLILQLAIQGKLTAEWRKQNPKINAEENCVEGLLEKVKEEKNRLIKNGIIKKHIATPKFSADEFPFQIPASWSFQRLNSISNINGGFAFKSSKYIDEGVRVIRISDFDERGFKEGKIVRYKYDDSLKPYALEENNILIAMTGGTVGKSYFVSSLNEPMVVNQRVATIKIFAPISEAYINCIVPTPLIQDVIKEAKNSTNDNISMTDIKNFIIPLPPLTEQQQIVKVVESLFKEVEVLENLTEKRIGFKKDYATSALSQLAKNDSKIEWQAINPQFHNFFNEVDNIKKLRETILQLAVQGKLTAKWRVQNPQLISSENSGEYLLEQIRDEKAKLIKEKKIKKEKALPPINEDEMPFNLPEGWAWEYLGNSMLKITDGTHHSPSNVENGEFKYISAKNIKANGIKLSNVTYVTEEAHREIYNRCNPEFGDLLYIKDGATTGVCCINDLDEEFSMLSSVALIKSPELILNEYLLRVMRSPYYYDLMRKGMTGVAITRVTLTKLKASIIPIPSLEEQKVIVQKANSLMNLCDQLEKEVGTGQQQIEDLMQSVLKEVFEKKEEKIKEGIY